MADKKQRANTMPLRVSTEALKLCRIAAGYAETSIGDYASRALVEIGSRDIERMHRKFLEPARGNGSGRSKQPEAVEA